MKIHKTKLTISHPRNSPTWGLRLCNPRAFSRWHTNYWDQVTCKTCLKMKEKDAKN